MRLLLISILLEICSVTVYSKVTCSSHETCGECTSFADDLCVWCSQVKINGRRCRSMSEVDAEWCSKEYRVDPTNTSTVSPPDLLSKDLRGGNDSIQFVPHNLEITTRPGLFVGFEMFYKPAKDFPIDVYYLMDHSYTMKQYTEDLIYQGRNIYETLKTFTNNVRFGVGSFIEKPALPYVDTYNQLAYSFINHLSLTDEIDKFVKILKDVPFGANYEDPEASLDALLQVMACEKELNWRSGARRVIVVCTDATYHSAGDGKMVGADLPNDMQCHLKNNSYDGELIYDYPSVSQINKVATEGKFIIIFAAVESVEPDYRELAKVVQGAKYAPLKTSRHSQSKTNIIGIIKDAYLESVRYMEISNLGWPSNVELVLEPEEGGYSNRYEILHNTVLHVKAKLRVTNCDGVKNPILKIGPSDLAENLEIKLNIVCECDCEKKAKDKTSKECSLKGSYQCGVCKCNEGRSGSICQCSKENTGNSEFYKCKANATDMHYCSSHGTCNCGKCDCMDDFSGNFCEYDDKACVRVGNKLCAGQGRCYLGRCNCYPRWTGDDCNCPMDDSTCIDPYSKKICSGNGVCRCGECECEKQESKNERYGGALCDSCDTCAERRCHDLESLVLCTFQNTTCEKSPNTITFIVNRTDINTDKWGRGEWCKKTFENGSWIVFKHYYDKDDRNIHVIIQDQLEMPPKADVWVPVGIAIGTVLLIGFLTVVAWKILVDYYDAKEYEKFAKEAQEAGFEVTRNPFYIDPRVEFPNPAFQQ